MKERRKKRGRRVVVRVAHTTFHPARRPMISEASRVPGWGKRTKWIDFEHVYLQLSPVWGSRQNNRFATETGVVRNERFAAYHRHRTAHFISAATSIVRRA